MITSSNSAIVFGFSVAGIAAATHLSGAGRSVELYAINDDVTLREQFVVSSAKIGKDLLGTDFEARAEGMLRETGVLVHRDATFTGFVGAVNSIQCELHVMASADKTRNLQDHGVIFAPNGIPRDSELLNLPNFVKALGRGVSQSAWSDAPFFADKKMVVVGDSSWALHQAAFAAQYSKKVKIFANSDGKFTNSSLFDRITKQGVEIVPASSVIDIRLDGQSNVSAVIYKQQDKLVEEGADAIFIAPDIVPSRDLLGPYCSVLKCGICNGIAFDSNLELEEDGAVVAEQLLLARFDQV